MAFSLQRVVIMNKTPAFLFTQLGWNKDNARDLIKALDAHTLQFKITEDFAPTLVLNLMATVAASVVEKKVAMANEANGDLGNAWLKTHSATSGPYRLVSWKPNELVTMEANPGYHLGPAKTKRVVIRHVPEPGSQQLLLEKGDIDIALSLQPDQLKALAGNKDIKIESFPYSGTWYIGLNLGDRAAEEPEGAARAEVSRRLPWNGQHLPQGPLHGAPDLPAHRSVQCDCLRSLQARRRQGEVAAGGGGLSGRLRAAAQLPQTSRRRSISHSRCSRPWAWRGVKVNIVSTDQKQLVSEFRARKFQATVISWTPDYLDPHTNASTFAFNDNDSDDAPHPLAWRCHYFDPAVNAKTTAAVKEIDPAKRKAMYEELQKILTDEGPYILMFQPANTVASRANVQGYKPGIVEDLYFFRTITKS